MNPIGDGQELVDWLAGRMRAATEAKAQTNGHATPGPASSPTDEQVIEKCRGAENAAKFADLFDHGDVHVYHDGDESRADRRRAQ